MNIMPLDRRRFLQLSGLGVVAIAADVACSQRADSALDQPALIAVLGADRVRQLGERYRAQTPSEGNAESLRAAIGKDRGWRIPFLGNESIASQIEDDFEHDRTVLVDGWVLAVTEARQAALFSLARA